MFMGSSGKVVPGKGTGVNGEDIQAEEETARV